MKYVTFGLFGLGIGGFLSLFVNAYYWIFTDYLIINLDKSMVLMIMSFITLMVGYCLFAIEND